jgi:hypothetical protein
MTNRDRVGPLCICQHHPRYCDLDCEAFGCKARNEQRGAAAKPDTLSPSGLPEQQYRASCQLNACGTYTNTDLHWVREAETLHDQQHPTHGTTVVALDTEAVGVHTVLAPRATTCQCRVRVDALDEIQHPDHNCPLF